MTHTEGASPQRFRKRPVEIEAVQFTGELPFPNGVLIAPLNGRAYVTTVHLQRVYVEPGDWIIPESDGVHFYPCKPDIFAATYEEVTA